MAFLSEPIRYQKILEAIVWIPAFAGMTTKAKLKGLVRMEVESDEKIYPLFGAAAAYSVELCQPSLAIGTRARIGADILSGGNIGEGVLEPPVNPSGCHEGIGRRPQAKGVR